MSLFQVQQAQQPAVDPPWVEKYRPKTIDDVSAQEHIVAVLRRTLTSTNLPHMLFYGPPGTGKTSTILALSRQLFGPDNFRSRVLELNASDERGIAIVREKIKNFARQTPRAQTVASDGRIYPCPPYKIIILDEADSMTQDAQAALRRIMENYARITRFCLVCNYVTRIIEPLASRCSKFRFTPLPPSSSLARLQSIATAEHLAIPTNILSTLIDVSNGDLRRAITYLQSAARLANADATMDQRSGAEITEDDVREIAGVVPEGIIRQFVASLGVDTSVLPFTSEPMSLDNSPRTSKTTYDAIRSQVRALVRQGFSATQVLQQLHDLLTTHPTLAARPKARCALAIAEADKALCDGADEELWLLDVAVRVARAVEEA